MPTDRSHVARNDAERARLTSLVARSTDQQLSHPLSAGWTVASVLGHLAFWDQRVVVVLERWRAAGVAAVPATLDHSAVDWINDATKPLLLALPPLQVGREGHQAVHRRLPVRAHRVLDTDADDARRREREPKL